MGFFSDLDEIETESKPSKKRGFFSDLPEQVSKSRSVASAYPKGLLKGATSLSELSHPVEAALRGAFDIKNTPGEIAAHAREEYLPTRDEPLENFLETAGEMTPTFALGPEALGLKALQIGAGAGGKTLLKEAGAPEWAQELGGAVSSLTPQAAKGLLSKKLIPNAAQKEAYDLLKGHGLTDKQITPFIRNKKSSGFLAGYGKAFLNREGLKGDLASIGNIGYDSLAERGKLLGALEGPKKITFNRLFNEQLQKIHPNYRELISKDIRRFKEKPTTWESLRELEQGIKIKIGDAEGRRAVLGLLKKPIETGEALLSPELVKEKRVFDKVYSSGKRLLKHLPQEAVPKLSKLESYGALGALAGTFITGNPLFSTGFLKGIVLKKGSEYAAAKLLTSPRFQNMRLKLLKAVVNDNKSAVLNLTSRMAEDLSKYTEEEPLE